MTEFTPWASLLGGALIGCASVLLMWMNGRIAGISGITSGALRPSEGQDIMWRLAFIAGLIVAPLLVAPTPHPMPTTESGALLVVAGLLVGFGSVWGSGCTSGHGVCGMSRFSVRSLISVVTFLGVAAVTVLIMRHGLGG